MSALFPSVRPRALIFNESVAIETSEVVLGIKCCGLMQADLIVDLRSSQEAKIGNSACCCCCRSAAAADADTHSLSDGGFGVVHSSKESQGSRILGPTTPEEAREVGEGSPIGEGKNAGPSGHGKWSSGRGAGSSGSILDVLSRGQGTLHIVMLGLDSSGKSTALYRLKFDQYLHTVPTIGFNCERIRGATGKAKVSGQRVCLRCWFVPDHVRELPGKCELYKMARQPENSQVPILVLANKQDLPGARDGAHIARLLGVAELGTNRLWHVQPACAVTGEGLDVALEQLYDLIHRQRRISRTCRRKPR
ncbi:ADP-ribosylation factor-like protein 4C [Hyalella azteca]|uniref:ADP-ribosylation factor-like protein 4C n=1 Tax=Hyalella azteca TaxID=294128 RepID=A0A979FJK4_HYAAZ|nr:ADP-ribosylation factor-like protein 4C [Hyalella azteca]